MRLAAAVISSLPFSAGLTNARAEAKNYDESKGFPAVGYFKKEHEPVYEEALNEVARLTLRRSSLSRNLHLSADYKITAEGHTHPYRTDGAVVSFEAEEGKNKIYVIREVKKFVTLEDQPLAFTQALKYFLNVVVAEKNYELAQSVRFGLRAPSFIPADSLNFSSSS